mmetsp:Transcript_97320/g.175778  ORF Transcript_97320/g.175778 Transcript_97320/m.175778 type:complete len:131 (+) Transcript_97320:186-578(+)
MAPLRQTQVGARREAGDSTTPERKSRAEVLRAVWGPSGEPGAPDRKRRPQALEEAREPEQRSDTLHVEPGLGREGAAEPLTPEHRPHLRAIRRPSQAEANTSRDLGRTSRERGDKLQEPTSPLRPRKLEF